MGRIRIVGTLELEHKSLRQHKIRDRMDGWAVSSSRVVVRLLSGPARRMFMGWIMGSNNAKYGHGEKYFESALSKYVTHIEKATEWRQN